MIDSSTPLQFADADLSMVEGRTSGTGHVRHTTFNEKGKPIRREPILAELHQRIRDVREGPDG